MFNEKLWNNKSVNCHIKNPRKFLVNRTNLSAYSTLISSSMEPEHVTFVKNRKVSDHHEDGIVYKRDKFWPLKDNSYRYWNCKFQQKFSCPVTIVSTIFGQKLISRKGEHQHSNKLIERTVREVEDEKI
jgi:hypothetical protein